MVLVLSHLYYCFRRLTAIVANLEGKRLIGKTIQGGGGLQPQFPPPLDPPMMGIASLKLKQEEAILSFLDVKDYFVSLHTGCGNHSNHMLYFH